MSSVMTCGFPDFQNTGAKINGLTVWLTCRLTLASQVTLKITFSTKWPPHPRAEGGQVEPVLGTSVRFDLCKF